MATLKIEITAPNASLVEAINTRTAIENAMVVTIA